MKRSGRPGILAGAVLFGILRTLRGRYSRPLGFALGILAGVPILLISRSVSHTTGVTQALAGLWIVVAFILWGVAPAPPEPAGAAGLHSVTQHF